MNASIAIRQGFPLFFFFGIAITTACRLRLNKGKRLFSRVNAQTKLPLATQKSYLVTGVAQKLLAVRVRRDLEAPNSDHTTRIPRPFVHKVSAKDEQLEELTWSKIQVLYYHRAQLLPASGVNVGSILVRFSNYTLEILPYQALCINQCTAARDKKKNRKLCSYFFLAHSVLTTCKQRMGRYMG